MRPRFALFVVVLYVLLSAISSPAQDGVPLPVPRGATAPIKSYHDRSMRDLDAIGNRNVGCERGVGNWLSL